jgi:hypothetical protein
MGEAAARGSRKIGEDDLSPVVPAKRTLVSANRDPHATAHRSGAEADTSGHD